MTKPTKKPKNNQSVWLMLGSAIALSLGGWAALVTQARIDTASVPVPAVVELPPESTASTVDAHAGAAQAIRPRTQTQPNVGTSSNTQLRRVRPMMRSRSSN